MKFPGSKYIFCTCKQCLSQSLAPIHWCQTSSWVILSPVFIHLNIPFCYTTNEECSDYPWHALRSGRRFGLPERLHFSVYFLWYFKIFIDTVIQIQQEENKYRSHTICHQNNMQSYFTVPSLFHGTLLLLIFDTSKLQLQLIEQDTRHYFFNGNVAHSA